MASPAHIAARAGYRANKVADLASQAKMAAALDKAPQSNVAAMLAARRMMIDRVLPEEPGFGAAYSIPRGADARAVLESAERRGMVGEWSSDPAARVRRAIDIVDSAHNGKSALGAYGSSAWESYGMGAPTNGGVLGVVAYPQGNARVRKHEVMHGLNDAARKGVPGMPFWSRVVASNPLGLGPYLDELTATAAVGPKALAAKTFEWPLYAYSYATDHHSPASAIAALATSAAPLLATGGAMGVAAGLAHGYMNGRRKRE